MHRTPDSSRSPSPPSGRAARGCPRSPPRCSGGRYGGHSLSSQLVAGRRAAAGHGVAPVADPFDSKRVQLAAICERPVHGATRNVASDDAPAKQSTPVFAARAQRSGRRARSIQEIHACAPGGNRTHPVQARTLKCRCLRPSGHRVPRHAACDSISPPKRHALALHARTRMSVGFRFRPAALRGLRTHCGVQVHPDGRHLDAFRGSTAAFLAESAGEEALGWRSMISREQETTETFLQDGTWISRHDPCHPLHARWVAVQDSEERIVVRIDLPDRCGGPLIHTFAVETARRIRELTPMYAGLVLIRAGPLE